MSSRCALLLMVMMFLLIPVGVQGQSEAPHAARSKVVVLVDASPEIFPASWRGGTIRARATRLSPAEQRRSLAALQRAADRYPASLLREHLEAVVLVRNLEYCGIRAAGTNSWNRVYLANRGLEHGYTEAYIEQVFHAEFSSVLLRAHAHRFDEAAWKALNPPGFAYGTSGVDAIRNGRATQQPEAELLATGFFNEYATSTLENDFNAVVIAWIKGGEKLADQRRRHLALDAKMQLVEAFYAGLNAPLQMADTNQASADDA